MTIIFKGIEIVEEGKFIHLTIAGKLEKEDYDIFAPEIDQQIKQYGKINLLVELIDFHGWTAGAAWEDTKLGVRHFNDIERLAIVGDKTWEKGMAYFSKAFTLAKVRYFDISERDEAEAWIREAQ
ncbi:MAG TPA: STAS/SEC14 domain-containing protein [Nitrosomonas mobilis]|nr:STAS/SEC14 domain-containing protein [Nitrosomonas mobilis]